MLKFFTIITIIFLSASSVKAEHGKMESLDKLAEQYVKLALFIGQYDPDFVDAYYGPEEYKPIGKPAATIPKDSLLHAVSVLKKKMKHHIKKENSFLSRRAGWMYDQLTAFARRIKIASGEFENFDLESKELFGVEAPHFPEAHFVSVTRQIDSLLPGEGSLISRIEAFNNSFIIPKEKLDKVFTTAIQEARRRTLTHLTLPPGESFVIEYVTNKPWSGYNWYKGNYQSVIQINTDLPIYIERAIDLACHEGYPGHHVYNVMLEKKLYREKGWLEISLYPLFSPQSFIAEGSANYGIEMAFPGHEKIEFAKNILFPLAGIEKEKADAYFKLLELRSQLSFARNEAARGYINGTMGEEKALEWLTNYSLYSKDAAIKSLSFIKKYRSYVINYNYGQEVIMNYIENQEASFDPSERWKLFEWLLSNPVRTKDLKRK